MLICKQRRVFNQCSLPPAVVLGLNPNGTDMEYSLVKHGINTYVVDFDKNSAQNDEVPPQRRADELLTWLNDFTEKHGNATVIPSSDLLTLLLSIISPKLDDRCRYLIPNNSIVQQCIDKFQFFSLCRELGVDTPETHLIEKTSDCDQVSDGFFPCIIKPYNNRKIPDHIISKVRSVKSKPELLELTEQILEYDEKFIIQKQIIGDSNDRFFVGGMVAKNPSDNALFIGKKLREIPALGGSTTHCILEWNEPVFDSFTSFVKKTNYVGLVDFEMMLDKTDGRYKIIEINPRIGAWHLISRTNKTNIIHYYYSLLNNINIDNYEPHIEGKTFLRPHTHFCSLTQQHNISNSLISTIRDLAGANIIAGFYASNPATIFKSIRAFLGCTKRRLLSKQHSS